eukprot:gnl/Hemi2/20280_TR6725_c0_g2_i1.p1 gnl/Hemi2/20280_TR6725_c0_g2~~gnl/Hemi2/20280_TR6725_c0_g2_i1.p1  ORF type:complete len:200 (+),score=22.90 gnl/Hemi2/20280_TR6725_c0_g2_i1:468-1067(+)
MRCYHYPDPSAVSPGDFAQFGPGTPVAAAPFAGHWEEIDARPFPFIPPAPQGVFIGRGRSTRRRLSPEEAARRRRERAILAEKEREVQAVKLAAGQLPNPASMPPPLRRRSIPPPGYNRDFVRYGMEELIGILQTLPPPLEIPESFYQADLQIIALPAPMTALASLSDLPAADNTHPNHHQRQQQQQKQLPHSQLQQHV